MQCRDSIVIFHVRIETAGKHGFEDRRIASLGRHVHQEMMLLAQIATQVGVRPQEFVCAHPVPPRTGRHKLFEQRELIRGAVSQQPLRHGLVAVQRGDGVRGAAVGPPLMDIRAVAND